MGINLGSSGRKSAMSEINVTPLVDVMLVLLIIFMVAAPMIQQGVKVELPQTHAAPLDAQEKRLILSIDREGKVFIGDAPVAMTQLEEHLRTNAKAQADKEIFLQADRTLPYGTIADVMAIAQRAGIPSVGMLTEPPHPQPEAANP